MKTMEGRIKLILLALLFGGLLSTTWAEEKLIRLTKLEMFVDDIPDMPKVKGYSVDNGVFVPKHLKIGMFYKKWAGKTIVLPCAGAYPDKLRCA